MPRDGNGNYTLPAGNPVVSNTVITSTWANDTMNDLANEMQDSLSRQGKGGLTAPLGIVDFSGATPGLNFTAEPTSGFKRQTTEDVRIQVTTTDVLVCQKTGVQILSGGSLKVPVVEETGQKVMRGVANDTTVYFYNDTPPADWVLKEPDTNVRELVIGPSGSGQGGTFAGTIDPINLTDTVSVSITGATGDGGAHTPTLTGSVGALNGETNVLLQGGGAPVTVAGDGHSHDDNFAIDPVSDHTHPAGTLAGSGSVTITPRYARGILATMGV